MRELFWGSRSIDVLSESEDKFKLLFDRSPLPKWVIELETLRFLDVNEAAVEHYGYSREEFLGMSVLDVRTPEAGEALRAALSRPPHQPPERDTCQHRKKSGEVIDVELRSSEITLAGKRVWLASINDITERKHNEIALRRAMEFDQAVMTNMGEGLYTVDAQGLVTFMNPAAERLFGWEAKDLLGKKMHDMTHYKHSDGRPFPAEECAGLQVLREGRTLTDYEDVFIRKDGTFFDVVYSSSPLREGGNGSIAGLVVVFRDVSERKRAEEALRKSEQRFAQFMRHLPGLAWIKDADGRYVYANDTAKTVFSPLGSEIHGKTDEDLFPPEIAAQFRRNDQQALASESGIQTIESLPQADGVVHHSIVSKFSIPSSANAEGIMVGGVAFDITERKQAEEAMRRSEENLRDFIENASVGLHWVGSDGTILWANQTELDLLGYTRDEYIGHRLAEFHADPSIVEDLLARLTGGETLQEYEARLRCKNGSIRHVLLNANALFENGQFVHTRCFTRDITDRKQAEESLKEADRRKNEFLAMLAHELRNPLAPIRNALEILRLTEGDAEAFQSASEMMDRQMAQMVRLVDDLLDVSRISQGKIELRIGFVDLASIINCAVETARPLCESKEHSLTVKLPPQPVYLNADPIRLVQVVENLLNNACKFTDRGGRIWLIAEVVTNTQWQPVSGTKESQHEGHEKLSKTQGLKPGAEELTTGHSLQAIPHAVIRVRDNGIGIAVDQLSSIFEMFTQIDTSLERTRGGLGIGLTLAKNLAELHGGTLEVHSAGLGEGSEFLVRLPVIEQTPTVQTPESTGSEPITTAQRILVVDDNMDSAESLTVLLDLTGNETRRAYDGLEALIAAETFRPDVILLDIGLPELNGYDVARRIREQPWGQNMILVALTGWGQEEDRRRSREAGFNHHLTKPVDPIALKKLLAGLFALDPDKTSQTNYRIATRQEVERWARRLLRLMTCS